MPYDFLVVATGLQLDYGQIAGMDVRAIGQNGMASVYDSPEAAAATWQAMDRFRQKGGRAVMTLPHTPLKCAGAPLKMTFMVDDRLREAGTRGQSSVVFYSALKDSNFSVKTVNDEVLRLSALARPAYGGLAAVWAWARQHWSMARVPRRCSVPAPRYG